LPVKIKFLVLNHYLDNLMKKTLFRLILLMAVYHVSQVTQAGLIAVPKNTLYACDFKYNSNIYLINNATAQVTNVGRINLATACTDLAFAGAKLYGTTFKNFLIVDPKTGKASVNGSYGLGVNDINALAVQPGTNKIFGAGSNRPGRFVAINPTTGRATTLGFYGSYYSSSGDLVFLKNSLYATISDIRKPGMSILAKISLSSGSVGRATPISGIWKAVSNKKVFLKNVYGLSVKNGVIYGAMASGEVIRINPVTAQAVIVGESKIGITKLTHGGMTISPP
jgi:hypothetical protein